MSKIWDEREKSLENEYFRRKEQELIENLQYFETAETFGDADVAPESLDTTYQKLKDKI